MGLARSSRLGDRDRWHLARVNRLNHSMIALPRYNLWRAGGQPCTDKCRCRGNDRRLSFLKLPIFCALVPMLRIFNEIDWHKGQTEKRARALGAGGISARALMPTPLAIGDSWLTAG
jgi:hypothetical protein